MRKCIVYLLFALSCSLAGAQEFRCNVSVNVEKLQNTTQTFETPDAKKFAEQTKEAIETFVNNRRWTNLDLEEHEKLDCSISLVINQRLSATSFKGQLTFQLRRPAYNSNYTSGLFNHLDDNNYAFTYDETRPLDFDPNSYIDNFTSTIAYYLYIMLGVYFDSFGSMGGTPFYEMAQNIAQIAGSAADATSQWRADGNSKSRYWLCENHTNAAYEGIREAYYLYSRQGIDLMTKDQKTARQNIILSLQKLLEVEKKKHNLISVTQFVDVKMQEIISIFTPAPDDEKKQVYTILRELSPLNANKIKDWNK